MFPQIDISHFLTAYLYGLVLGSFACFIRWVVDGFRSLVLS